MREILFRAWDKKNAVMISDVDSVKDLWLHIDNIFRDYGVEDSDDIEKLGFETWDGEMFFLDSDYVELMQYTGLKDKNGAMIFEGDICRVLYTGWGSKHLGTPEQQAMTLDEYLDSIAGIKVVQWDTNGFYVSHKIDGYSESMEVGRYGYIEIIGNIYENTELIK